ncbi:SAF domain-containing protein [Saccharothrix obliqua]|uniref:SAF domain-containing protein n=1 Tax=Saccharothrix obliqua TaxID=2861747 RepID=UPI001C5DB484|nr:SAF domain-containing protein [Saccharothrix obliqua]MBW4719090.1 hypothetical protein [Saccharothrix obliqua]
MNLTRKLLAAAFALLALAVATWPTPPRTPVAVAARDLPADVPLTPADLKLVHVPPELSPAGAVPVDKATGRALTAPARAGEPLTDARLATPDPSMASVAVHLPGPATTLLRTGSRVDVIGEESAVLAEQASVTSVRDDVVVLTLPHQAATRVASAALSQPVTVTLR